MSDMKTAIMDAAERRMQQGGFGGFSFREIAADVGIKSSSVHYHFPTKDDLGAAVVRRWRERAADTVERMAKQDPDPVRAWASTFRKTAFSKNRICPCTVLAAASQDLPIQVAREVKHFFAMFRDNLIGGGLSEEQAAEAVSTITGALVIANALGDKAEYDRATQALLRQRTPAAAAPKSVRQPATA